MANKTCQDCPAMIDEKYVRCVACNAKRKESQPQGSDAMLEVLKELRLMNNNLAHIRAAVCNDEKLKESLSKPHKPRP